MKLIQLSATQSFLTFPKMTIDLEGNKIIFASLEWDGLVLRKFECYNEATAAECHTHLIDCLTDPESQSCDLPYRDAKMKAAWDLAPTLGPAILALQAILKTDCSFTESKPLKDALLALDPKSDYANSNGVPSYWGKYLIKFHSIQEAAK